MGDARRSYSAIKLLGVEGKRVNIIPTTKGMNLTELYSKDGDCIGEYMGAILYDKKWKKYVLVDLDKKMQMSLGCLKEAFQMTEEYWKKNTDWFNPYRENLINVSRGFFDKSPIFTSSLRSLSEHRETKHSVQLKLWEGLQMNLPKNKDKTVSRCENCKCVINKYDDIFCSDKCENEYRIKSLSTSQSEGTELSHKVPSQSSAINPKD